MDDSHGHLEHCVVDGLSVPTRRRFTKKNIPPCPAHADMYLRWKTPDGTRVMERVEDGCPGPARKPPRGAEYLRVCTTLHEANLRFFSAVESEDQESTAELSLRLIGRWQVEKPQQFLDSFAGDLVDQFTSLTKGDVEQWMRGILLERVEDEIQQYKREDFEHRHPIYLAFWRRFVAEQLAPFGLKFTLTELKLGEVEHEEKAWRDELKTRDEQARVLTWYHRELDRAEADSSLNEVDKRRIKRSLATKRDLMLANPKSTSEPTTTGPSGWKSVSCGGSTIAFPSAPSPPRPVDAPHPLAYATTFPFLCVVYLACLVATPFVLFLAWQLLSLRKLAALGYRRVWLPGAIVCTMVWGIQAPVALLYFLLPVCLYCNELSLKWKSLFLSYGPAAYHLSLWARSGVLPVFRAWADTVLSLARVEVAEIGGMDFFARDDATEQGTADPNATFSGVRRHPRSSVIGIAFLLVLVWCVVSAVFYALWTGGYIKIS